MYYYEIETAVSTHEGDLLECEAETQGISVEQLVSKILKNYLEDLKSETYQTLIQTQIKWV